MSDILLTAVGDVLVDREDHAPTFRAVQALFDESHVVFGNCEAVYSPTEDRFHDAVGKSLHDPACFAAVDGAGFDVMSYANNHALDGGYTGMRDTLALLHDAGIRTVGAGEDLEEARRPAVVPAGKLSVGFLAYTCVFPAGAGAGPGRPGLATIPVHTAYQPEAGQPGTRPIVLTFVDPAAKASIAGDVAALRARCDIVVVSVHWGVHLLPAELATYERELGHTLIDAGADIVLGHHQHIIKGIELYEGKPIFYGLGNFVLDHRQHGDVRRSATNSTFGAFYGEYRARPREDYPLFPFHPESRLTMLARLRLGADGLADVAIRPAAIEPSGCPIPLDGGTAEHREFVEYLRDISARADLDTAFEPRGDEIAVGSA